MKRKYLLIALFAVLISALAMLVGCSAVSDLVGNKQLSTPTNISYDGETITWDPVENASKYYVTINSGTTLSVVTNSRSYDNTEDQFTVSIQAIASNESYNSETATHTFIRIDGISDVEVSDEGVVSWSALNDVSGYEIEVDGKIEAVSSTKYSSLEAGDHTVRVRGYVEIVSDTETDTSYYCPWSAEKDIIICADVDVDTIKYSSIYGSLSWSSVKNASKYDLTITGEYATENVTVSTNSYSFDPQNGSFTVTIKAIGNHSTSYDCQNETTKKFVYLEAPTNLRVESGILYWDEVEEATSYAIKINGTTQNASLTECQYSGFAAGRSYTINILPECDDTVYFSSWSADYSFNILEAPELKWLDMGLDGTAESSIYWDGVDNAAGYVILVTTPSGQTVSETYGESARSFAYDYSETGVYTVRIKSTASSIDSNKKDSVYSEAITVTRLAAPKFASNNYITSDANSLVKGFTVTFQSVQGATAYQIYKDEVASVTITNTQYSDADLTSLSTITEQTYSYKIQSLGSSYNTYSKSVILSSLSANSLEFSITVLATPDITNEPISGYVYSYSSVQNASGYCVDIDGAANVNDSTTKDLSGLSEGSHVVSVCARGNGSNILASNYTAEVSVVRLSAPTDVYIRTDESEGMLVFTAVEHAKSYSATIDSSTEAFAIDSATDISSYISTTGTTMHFTTVANYFDQGTYYMTSPSGSTSTFVKLAAPNNLTFTGSQLVWNSPANVGSYTPTYTVYNGQGVTQAATTGTSISTAWLEGGQAYTMTVKAIGSTQKVNGTQYINSDYSQSVSAYKLMQPKVTTSSSGYSWYAVTYATSYAVYVDGVLSETDYHVSGNTYTYTPNFDDIKTYVVEIYAIGSTGETMVYIDSEATQINQVTKQLATPDFSVSYSKDYVSTDGEIVVTITKQSEYANGYYYSIGGVTNSSTSTTYSLNPNTAGEVVVRVYAAGGTFDDEGTYYINSQSTSSTIYLLGSPTSITLSNDGAISWGAVDHASMYDLTIEYTLTDGTSGTYTVTNNRTVSFDWANIYYEKGITWKSVVTLKVTIYAKGASNCVTSAPASNEWTQIH